MSRGHDVAYDPSAPYDGAPPHMNREESDSAPPEGIGGIGAGVGPGLGATGNCPGWGPAPDQAGPATATSSVTNFAFSSLSGPSSADTALSSRAAPLRRAAASASAAAT